MNNTISAVIPSYNTEGLIKNTLDSAKEFPILAVDNDSNDNTTQAIKLNRPDAEIHSYPSESNRTANWEHAIQAFLSTDYTWLKWLFAGDQFLSTARKTLDNAISSYPTARMIITNYYSVSKQEKKIISPPSLKETTLLQPGDSLYLSAKHGNWFGPPIAHAIHREALEQVNEISKLPYMTHMEIALQVCSKFPVLYVDLPIGEFHLAHRKNYRAYKGSLRALLEESLMQVEAQERFLSLTQNIEKHHECCSQLQFQLAKKLVKRGELGIARHTMSNMLDLVSKTRMHK